VKTCLFLNLFVWEKYGTASSDPAFVTFLGCVVETTVAAGEGFRRVNL